MVRHFSRIFNNKVTEIITVYLYYSMLTFYVNVLVRDKSCLIKHLAPYITYKVTVISYIYPPIIIYYCVYYIFFIIR